MKNVVNALVAWVLGIATVLWVAALFGFGSGYLTEDPPAPEENPYAAGTTTAVSPSDADTGGESATTAAPAPARFIVSAIGFEHDGWVEIRNIGASPGSLAGHWICQGTPCLELPAITLGPSDSMIISAASAGPELDQLNESRNGVAVTEAVGSLGPIAADGGEIGLYVSSGFDDPSAIIAYVAWGASGGGRSSTAVAAGVWTEGSFVDPAGALIIEATSDAPTSADGWSGG